MIPVIGQNYTISVTKKSNKHIIDSRELSILVSLYGLSFVLKNKADNSFKHFEYQFNQQNPIALEKKLLEIIEERTVLKNTFSAVNIVHHNNLFTLVPQTYFSQDILKDYLKFNVQLLDNDFAAYDEIRSLDTNNVYLPFVNINNTFLDYNEHINYYHSGTQFLNKILQINQKNAKMYLFEVNINVFKNSFQLAIFKNEALQFFNHFDYENIDEFLYYLFFTLETFKITKWETKYTIFGLEKNHEIIKNLKDYTKELIIYPGQYNSEINNFIL